MSWCLWMYWVCCENDTGCCWNQCEGAEKVYWGALLGCTEKSGVVRAFKRRAGCSSSMLHVLGGLEGQSSWVSSAAMPLWWESNCCRHFTRGSDCWHWDSTSHGGSYLQAYQGSPSLVEPGLVFCSWLLLVPVLGVSLLCNPLWVKSSVLCWCSEVCIGQLNYVQLFGSLLQGDMQALEDLTYDKRRKFLAKYTFPHDLPTLSFHTEASRSLGWISTMSHIAHAELPWLPGSNADLGRSSDVGGARVPVAIPLAAAMAVCALHLELRYGEKSDGLVTRKDAEIPGSIVVRPEKKLDHGWMVFSQQSVVNRKDPFELDAPKMCEALLTLLLNHDKWRRSDSQLTPEAAAAVKDAHACAVLMKQDWLALLTQRTKIETNHH